MSEMPNREVVLFEMPGIKLVRNDWYSDYYDQMAGCEPGYIESTNYTIISKRNACIKPGEYKDITERINMDVVRLKQFACLLGAIAPTLRERLVPA